MKVRELIAALLNENMDEDVFIKTKEGDWICVDGVEIPSAAPTHTAVFLSTDSILSLP